MSNIHRFDKIGKDGYDLYCSMLKAGFTQANAIPIMSLFFRDIYIQQSLKDEAEANRMLREVESK